MEVVNYRYYQNRFLQKFSNSKYSCINHGDLFASSLLVDINNVKVSEDILFGKLK
jgi:hypothetical protein